MPARKLVISPEAIDEINTLLARRKRRDDVLACIQDNALAVAADLTLARPYPGPGDFYTYFFQCRDGETALYIRMSLRLLPDDSLIVLSANTAAI